MVACGALLVVASCTGGSDDPSAPESSALDTYYDQEPIWGACLKAEGECTGIDVPLDYAEPDGETVNLVLRRFAARVPGERIGTLFYNPGGPGLSGVAAVSSFARRVSDDVRDRFDIIGFDPRGIGGSDGLGCTAGADPRSFLAPDFTPDSASEESALVGWARHVGRECVDWDGDLVRHMSSIEVARDLDIMRSVVGDDRLHFVGASYGTVIGADYAELFPDRVGRLVLDSAVDPTRTQSDLDLDRARGHERALRGYLRYCVRQQCPMGDSVPEAIAGVRRLVSDTDADPLGAGVRGRLTENAARAAFEYGLAASAWPALTKALRSAVDGDGGPLRRMARTWFGYAAPGDDLIAQGAATLCLDSRERLSLGEIRRLSGRLGDTSPVFGEFFAWSEVICSVWPVDPTAERLDIDGAGADPIMVVGSVGDPITTYRQSVALADQLESGFLVTRQRYGHGAYAVGDRCVDGIVDAYLLGGGVPQGDTTC